MKRIVNWTFGGFFRTIGRTIAFLLLGGLIVLIAHKNDIKITQLLGIETIKADTLNYSSVQYRLFWYEFNGDDWVQGNNSYTSAGTSVNVQYKGVWAWNTQINLGSNTMVAGRTYKVTMTYTMSPANILLYQNYKNWIYWDNPVGTGNSNGSNLSEDNIDRFSATFQPNCETCARNSVIYYVTPAVDLKVIQFRLRIRPNNYALTGDDPSLGFNTMNQPAGDYIKITWTTDESAIAIQEQTEIIKDMTEQLVSAQDRTNELLNDDNIPDGQNQANSFFNNFTTNDHGLTGIITAPLNAINSLTSATCSPLVLPLPFMTNKNITLPCMRNIYTQNFGAFMNLYDIITTGIIAYWVCVRIFGLVKDFKNPDHDEIEVVDL